MAFPWAVTSTGWGWGDYGICVYFMTGTPVGSTESGFMEKPVIEPVSDPWFTRHRLIISPTPQLL